MAENYDLIVIGSGPGGYVAAIRAGQLGLKTAIVEKDPQYGGTCLHRGCIPTKALLHTASVLDEARHGADFGVNIPSVELDMNKAHEYKNKVVQKNAKGVAYLLKKNGVTGIQGFGRLVSPQVVDVTGPDGSTTSYGAKNILIATGSVVRDIPVAAVDGHRIVNSDHMLQEKRVPAHLVVLGAGAVGTEFASIFASFGSKVTIVEMMPRLLPIEDEEVSAALDRSFRKRGIGVKASTKLAGVETTESGVRLQLESEKGSETLEAEMLLVAVGRAPVTEGIGLDRLGIETDRGYIPVSETMQTSVPNVYAIGDIVPTPWLAHVASAEGIVAVEHMAGANYRPLNYDLVPSVTYCEPEVASVGLTENEARERGYDVAVGKFPFTALGKAAIVGKTEGFAKVVRETRYDQILGVHIIGAHATDLIAEACVALQVESTTEELFRTIHAHPTLSEAVAEAAHAAVGHAIHA